MTDAERAIAESPERLAAFHAFIRKRFRPFETDRDCPLPEIGRDQYRKAVADFAAGARP